MRPRTATAPDEVAVLPWMNAESWGYRAQDLALMRRWDRSCNRVLEDGSGAPVAFASTFTYGDVGWIGNVITDPTARGRGLGRAVMAEAERYLLQERAVEVLALYAYRHTEDFYDALRWRPQDDVAVLVGTLAPPTTTGVAATAPVVTTTNVTPPHIPSVLRLDRPAFGADRAVLLEELLRRPSARAVVATDHVGRPAGFGVVRDEGPELLVGPLVCPDVPVAAALAAALLGPYRGRRALVTVPLAHRFGVHLLGTWGLHQVDTIVLMTKGGPLPWDPRLLLATGAPEKG